MDKKDESRAYIMPGSRRKAEELVEKAQDAFSEFFRLESSGGILLGIAAILALLIANSPLSTYYDMLLSVNVTVMIGSLGVSKAFIYWVNDGLMAVFFLLVGLEIKREVVEGNLSSPKSAVLPVAAAIGGVALPALIYLFFNADDPMNAQGWAIPAATDIAFSLGVLSLLGPLVPLSLKMFLVAIAVFDDLIAIIIIALFYTDNLALEALQFAGLGTAVLILFNVFNVRKTAAYITVGVLIWLAVLKSGVHATLAGVIVGLVIPMHIEGEEDTPLETLEHSLHPWVAFLILPVFAFANAGVSFAGMAIDSLLHPVTLGIAAGLFVGKQVGVFGASFLMIKMGLARMPEQCSWLKLWGVSLLAGVGFTMSLFIGSLAFEAAEMDSYIRLGVLGASLVAAVCGYLVLRLSLRQATSSAANEASSG